MILDSALNPLRLDADMALYRGSTVMALSQKDLFAKMPEFYTPLSSSVDFAQPPQNKKPAAYCFPSCSASFMHSFTMTAHYTGNDDPAKNRLLFINHSYFS